MRPIHPNPPRGPARTWLPWGLCAWVGLTGLGGNALPLLRAEPRLLTRLTLLGDDARCTFRDRSNWRPVTLPNGGTLLVTQTAGEWADYPFALPGTSGRVDLKIYKYRCDLPLDDGLQVEIHHRGRKELAAVDASTPRDGWYSLGTYDFAGDGTERLRFSRVARDSQKITPAPMIRFDVYYDTMTRPQTAAENAARIPHGYSESGAWQVSAQPGYRPAAAPRQTNKTGASAVWHPGPLPAGTIGIYTRRPNVDADDRYEIFHDGKVDTIHLKNLKYSNLDLYNPVTKLGWYKLGEFHFTGHGDEFVRMTKASAAAPSVADGFYFEHVRLDGTILHRTVVLPRPDGAGSVPADAGLNFEQKVQAARIPPGFSPQESVNTSAKFGSTIYSRALFFKADQQDCFWNPCLTDGGDYELLYYLYWPPKTEGRFEVVHGGRASTARLGKEHFGEAKFVNLGTFHFSGGAPEEYIRMNGIDRASDLLLEKKTLNPAVLKQVVVTAHPYFKHVSYRDTSGHPAEHEISFMVLKGYVTPAAKDEFAPGRPMTTADFARALRLMLEPNAVEGYDLFQGIPAAARLSSPDLTRAVAAQLLATAGEVSGHYQNVVNLFQTHPAVVLSRSPDAAAMPPWAREAVARMVESEVLSLGDENRLQTERIVSRAEGTVTLKNFLEKILGSGPPPRADWELTFQEEFNGDAVDWARWKPEAAVRFKGVSAKWGENCVVEGGTLKGYNYQDNRGAPYSSGCLESRFSQTYGFFEARMKYPDRAYGSHTSFWTSSRGGDFNYNEGTYPNGVCPNNYFLGSTVIPGLDHGRTVRSYYFTTPTNLARDFHCISGFLDDRDMYYGFDGRAVFEVKDYARYYARPTSTTNVPYSVRLSTVITYFDGPLDRDRIDGSSMEVDWVRIYRQTQWLPALVPERSLPAHQATGVACDCAPVLKFNKPVARESLTPARFVVRAGRGGPVPPFRIEPVTPLRVRLVFEKQLQPGATYIITVQPGVTDLQGNAIAQPATLSFQTAHDG